MRVLVADDNRDSVLTLSSLLWDEGHVVEEVYTGAVLLDIKMPSDRLLCKIAGFDCHVPKPCDPNALLALLKD